MRYELSPRHPDGHLFAVALELDAPDPAGQALMLPAWIPGSDMIRDFARHVVTLHASDDAGAVAVTRDDERAWRCAPASRRLRVDYADRARLEWVAEPGPEIAARRGAWLGEPA